MSKNIQINNKTGKTLEEFITNNEVLLSSTAVMATLIFFSRDLSPHFIAELISFLLVGGIILLWLEIWFKFPEQVQWRLFLFRYVLLWSVAGVIFSWVYEYRAIWDMCLFIPVSIIFFAVSSSSITQTLSIFATTRNFFGIGIDNKEKTPSQKWMRRVAILLGLFLSFFMGVWFSYGINVILDITKFNFPKI